MSTRINDFQLRITAIWTQFDVGAEGDTREDSAMECTEGEPEVLKGRWYSDENLKMIKTIFIYDEKAVSEFDPQLRNVSAHIGSENHWLLSDGIIETRGHHFEKQRSPRREFLAENHNRERPTLIRITKYEHYDVPIIQAYPWWEFLCLRKSRQKHFEL